MRIFLLSLTLAFTLSPAHLHAEELNAGFVQGLWYSSETIFADTPVRVYVALRNNTDSDLSGTVRFTDNEANMGTSYVSALPGRLVEAWTDWTPTYGEHTLRATLTDIKLLRVGEEAQSAEVTSTLAEDTFLVDYDTDGDGVGNEEDNDDDGDGISDETETENDTDPLVYTKPEPSKKEGIETSHENVSDTQENEPKNATGASTEGFEKYFDGGTVDNLLAGATEKVAEAKESLDTYREERNTKLAASEQLRRSTGSKTLEGTATGTTTGELATITRTKIQSGEPGLIASVFKGISDIVSGLYTLILWTLSNFLAHPALVQLSFLFGILFISYKLARKLGQRPR